MSHELRTPLNVIIGFSDMLTKEEPMKLDAARREEYAQLINESGHHLLSIVNGILDMSKIEAGSFEITREPFAPAQVVAGCCDLMALKASQAGIVDGAADHKQPAGDHRRQARGASDSAEPALECHQIHRARRTHHRQRGLRRRLGGAGSGRQRASASTRRIFRVSAILSSRRGIPTTGGMKAPASAFPSSKAW